MRACNVDLKKLRGRVIAYLDLELDNLVTDGAEDSSGPPVFSASFNVPSSTCNRPATKR